MFDIVYEDLILTMEMEYRSEISKAILNISFYGFLGLLVASWDSLKRLTHTALLGRTLRKAV